MLRVLTVLMALMGTTFQLHGKKDFEDFVDSHNKKNVSWKAEISGRFDYDDSTSLTSALGINDVNTKNDANFKNFNDENNNGKGNSGNGNNGNGKGNEGNGNGNNGISRKLQSAPPASLDLRASFPNCWSLGYIRDQAGCGSCWAFSSMTSLSDRYCIKYSTSTATVQRSFSYEDLLECCPGTSSCAAGNGCNGGYMTSGFSYAKLYGISTGENYGNYTNCKPYFLPSGYSGQAPACASTCKNTFYYPTPYANDKLKISSYTILAGANIATVVASMKNALYNRGPIIVYMDVYQDFFAYKSGVYVHTSGAFAGGHAVRVIGYGTENGLNYWLIANSWGKYWGASGFFKIQSGVNMVNIEAYPVEGII